MKANRDSLRKDLKKILSNLDPDWMKSAADLVSENLCHLLASDNLKDKQNILAWTSFFKGEIDLTPAFITLMKSRTLYLPRSLPDGSMHFLSIGPDWLAELSPGMHGIPEPTASSDPLPSINALYDQKTMAENTIVLVPGVAFDLLGNRLGRGKGYYDRFLAGSFGRNVIKVGICWQLQVVDSIPSAPHDVPVDYICHEEGVIRTSLDIDEDNND